ncbi:helix-turn-helix domain-containing protein [Ottowia sp.]|uniref:helix-turn-helix domain-containing protein n=1 Tax=Ottowia sp. TaxID=1898956 RepID=UPI0025F44A2F|nr:helix-turn-helix domain-containing protein [Ottowia sp.]MBK6613916.1 helix-turn-helix domain-containing protein [Ottowia sp.]MBK6745522.1 helix-turn-helix domain-containing protein [Ottowia sp.]
MSEQEQGPAGAHVAPPSADQPSAGAMLRQLRESAGVNAAVLASAMKVSVQKLEALEADRLELLPDVTFARGLASSICRSFGADPAPVLERMPVVAPGLPSSGPSINQPFRRASDGPASMLSGSFSRPLLIAVALLLAGAALLWLLPTLPIRLGAPEPAVTPSGDGTVRESVTPSVAAPEPSAPAEMPEGAASAEQGAPATAAASQPGSATAGDLLVFTATGETWVAVRDAAGRQLLNRTLASGQIVGVTGVLPLAVTVGRKDAVTVTVRGQPFDHKSLSRTTVSRFEVN